MTDEIDIGGGIFIPGFAFWGAVSLALNVPLRWLMGETGLYRFVWHRGLFDICVFVILWGALAAVASVHP